jgi:hypothetical protein
MNAGMGLLTAITMALTLELALDFSAPAAFSTQETGER